MRHGRRDEDTADLVHDLNQRYRREFDRAERLQAELQDLQRSRFWPWFRRLRRFTGWTRSLLRRSKPSTLPTTPRAWYQLFEPASTNSYSPRQVTVIIPFRDQLDLLTGCLRALKKTAPEVDVVLVDNGSLEPRTRIFLNDWETLGLGRVMRQPEPFNFARLCNAGSQLATTDLLLFLNNDVTASEPGWLEAMLAVAADLRVGIVGATLLYPDHTLQHVGLAPTGRAGAWEHPYRFADALHAGADGELGQVRAVPAVTGACLLIRRDLFSTLGGFDERYAITMNDVDLCRRVRDVGREIVVTPHARLIHFESLSRGYRREAA
jgi:GT2 family glycosyltransferase